MILADRAAEHAEAAAETGRGPCHVVRAAAPAADLGRDRRQGPDRSRVVHDRRLVRDLPRRRRATRSRRRRPATGCRSSASGLGNFFGGGFSAGSSAAAGRSAARAALVIAGGSLGVLALVPAAFASSFRAPARVLRRRDLLVRGDVDAWPTPCPPTSSRAGRWPRSPGLAGTAAGLGTIGSTYLIGVVADRFSFTPILVVASFVPLTGRAPRPRPRPQHAGVGPGRAEGDLMAAPGQGRRALRHPTLFRSFFDAAARASALRASRGRASGPDGA